MTREQLIKDIKLLAENHIYELKHDTYEELLDQLIRSGSLNLLAE